MAGEAAVLRIGKVPLVCRCGQLVYQNCDVTLQTNAKVANVRAPWLLPVNSPLVPHRCPEAS